MNEETPVVDLSPLIQNFYKMLYEDQKYFPYQDFKVAFDLKINFVRREDLSFDTEGNFIDKESIKETREKSKLDLAPNGEASNPTQATNNYVEEPAQSENLYDKISSHNDHKDRDSRNHKRSKYYE
jgi:hypothetical protein